jgi:hypothetical protein
MKYFLLLSALCIQFWASAQKHRAFADVGYAPGFSATYNYSLVKYVGAGIGVQGYDCKLNIGSTSSFYSAVFADIRFNIRPQKRGQAFAFIDLGANFYQRSNYTYTDRTGLYRASGSSGLYTGWGVAYLRRITKRGSGIYLSYKIISNIYNADRLNPYTLQPIEKVTSFDATGILSVGFKY